MKDFLIIGNGLGGIFFSDILLKNNKSINIIADQSQNSTSIAIGLYNPVILKRYTMAWEAHIQSKDLIDDYISLQNLLNQKFIFPLELLRKLTSIEEQNNWSIASDKLILKEYLNSDIILNKYSSINAPFGFGSLRHTGYVNTKLLQESYSKYLESKDCLIKDSFDYNNLIINEDFFIYNNIEYKNIIFCEGFGIQKNHFFNYIPLDGTKGELLTIKSSELKLDKIINSSIFIIPIGKDLYRVGATYHWTQKDDLPTIEAKEELLSQLDILINCKYEVIDHQAGVRPTVKDRRPLLGEHPIHKNMYILNGLGTRGVMLAPYLSKIMFEFITNKTPISKEIDVKRYSKFLK